MGLFSRGRSLVDIWEDEQRSLTRAQQPWPIYGTVIWTDIGPDDAMRISDVFACVRLLADTAASLPLVAYRHLADGDRERFSGRLTDLLATPSPGNVTANLIGTAVAHLNLHGNCYIGKFRDSDGIVTQLAPLHPAGMTVELVRGAPRYTYVDQNGAQQLGTADVLHLKALSVDGVLGLSPVAQTRAALGLAQNLGKHADTFAANAGRPGGVLRVPGWRSAQGTAPEDVRADWERMFVGTDNTGKLLILTGAEDVQYEQFALSMADAQFIEQRQLSSQEIARIFRVPPHLIGAPVSSSLTYSNAEQESLDFLKFSLGPTLRLISSAITSDPDLSPSTVFVEFDLLDLLRADSLTRAQVYQLGLAGGWLTVDEIRQRENLPRLPASPASSAVVGMAQIPTTPAPPGPSPPAPNDPGGPHA